MKFIKITTGLLYTIMSAALLSMGACNEPSPRNTSAHVRFDSCHNYVQAHRIDMANHLDTVEALCKEILEIPVAQLTPEQQKLQVKHYLTLTSCYLMRNDMEQMLGITIAGEKKAEELGDPDLICLFSTSIGGIYSAWHMQKQADFYLDKAVQMIPQVDDKQQMLTTYMTKGGSLMNIGDAKGALIYMDKADSVRQTIDEMPTNLQFKYGYTKGWIYSNIPDSAESCVRTLAPLCEQYRAQKQFVGGYSTLCFNLGKAYETLNKHQEAMAFFDEAQELINSNDNNLINYDAALYLVERHIAHKDDRRAINLLPHWHQLYKNFYSSTITNLLTAYNVEYQSNQKDRELENLQWQVKTRNLQIIIYSILILVLLAALILCLYVWHKRKQQIRQLFEMLLRRHLEWKNLNLQLIENYNQHLMIETTTSSDVAEQENSVSNEPKQQEKSKQLEDPTHYEVLYNIYSRTLYIMERDKPFLNPKLTIDELAQLAMTNRTHLSSAINRITHNHFNLWLAEYRVNYLIELVYGKISTNKSIDELYTMAGFSSRSTFYRQFKQVTGLTPKQFVKRMK